MDKALKQRLVGASVLVALAVVVLPMLLSGQPDPQQESRTIELPARPPELEIETRRFPIGRQDEGQPSVVPDSPPTRDVSTPARDSSGGLADAAQPAGSEPETTGPANEPMESESGDAAPGPVVSATDTEPVADADSAAGRYLVQVASFSGTGNANRLAGMLSENDMPVVMDTIETEAGRLHRVRIGPYDRREDADAAIAALNSRMPDLSPRLLDLAPDEGAPVTDPSDPLVHWVVQVGSFSESSNAENLVYRLRDAGYRASSARVSDASGAVFKVRVGPLIERQEALRIQASIRDEMGIDGLVMSAD